MNALPFLTSLLGWTLALNICLLIISTMMLSLFKKQVTKVHAKLFNMKKDALGLEYFRYLANYKLLVIVFNLTPWLALKLMSLG